MKILCTFPGKFGDLLWALPTVRAISRRIGAPISLLIGKQYASITPLIAQQPYIQICAAMDDWEIQDTAPVSPRVPAHGRYEDWLQANVDQIIHLGYRGWPDPDLARHTWETARQALAPDAMLEELDLQTPWITPPDCPYNIAWTHGFTDEHFELKYGLVQLLTEVSPKVKRWARAGCTYPPIRVGASPRWELEAEASPVSWVDTASLIASGRLFLGDCSALHVLAVALGVPVVLMEPNPHRHGKVFYPLGQDGPQVMLVKGVDGQPTFDARHVRETIDFMLKRPGAYVHG